MINSILPLYGLSSGCDYHRILLPLGYAGYDFSQLEEMTNEKLHSYKVVVFNRIPVNIEVAGLKKLQEKGLKLAIDMDDYWYLYKEHLIYEGWIKNNFSQRLEELMRISDVVTCTTKRLADKIIPFNQNVHILPNALPFESGQFNSVKTSSDKVRFGFVGSSSHLHDLRTIVPVFQHFSQLDFTMCGYVTNPVWDKMEAVCSNNGTNKNYKRVDQRMLDSYMDGYTDLDCCIAPLTNVDFNQYKSNLKILEAGVKKCAIICSANPCYTDTVPDELVTFCKSIKDWKLAIKKHQDIEYTQAKGLALHDWVKANYDLKEVNKSRFKLYETLSTR